MPAFDFLVNQPDLSQTQLEEVSVPSIQAGEILFEVERFALTANNITYGVAGDMIGYWQFFQTEASATLDKPGRIPVWGIATVIESACDEVSVGERFYGYYPMSSHLVIQPGKVSQHGLFDMVDHRQALPPVYNQYTKMTDENGFSRAIDNHQVVYRPLFTTSFVLDDFFDDNDFFGAKQIILSSASSKTSFGMAYQLKQRDIKVIGLTSNGNKAFVKSLGLYDSTITYDEVETLDASIPTAYVDMSGNRTVLSKIHHHFSDQLKYSCGVGITHWDARDGEDPKTLPGAAPAMFFAPSQIQKRNKEWGPEVFQAKLAESWNKFISEVETWVQFEITQAPKDLDATYQTVLAGPSPDTAYVVLMK